MPPDEISGRFMGAVLALAALLWVMAWVDKITAATAGSVSAGGTVVAAREWTSDSVHRGGALQLESPRIALSGCLPLLGRCCSWLTEAITELLHT